MAFLAFTLLALVLSICHVSATPLAPHARVSPPDLASCTTNVTCPSAALDGTPLITISTTSLYITTELTCTYSNSNSGSGSTVCTYFTNGAAATRAARETSYGNCPIQAACECGLTCPLFSSSLSTSSISLTGASYDGDLRCQYFNNAVCYYSPDTGLLDPAFYSRADCPDSATDSCPTATTIDCPLSDLQCCDSLNFASEPGIANALGLAGVPVPAGTVIVGVNCSSIPPAAESVASSCLGIISCCTTVGLGNNGTISEGCDDAEINPSRRSGVPRNSAADDVRSMRRIGNPRGSGSAGRKRYPGRLLESFDWLVGLLVR